MSSRGIQEIRFSLATSRNVGSLVVVSHLTAMQRSYRSDHEA